MEGFLPLVFTVLGGFFGVAENFNSDMIISVFYLITSMHLELVHQIVAKSYNQLAN